VSELPPRIQRVCSRCGSPVTVTEHIVCPVHGALYNAQLVMTRAEWLLLEATIERHPAGKQR
jgi:uncharacterized Zn finger protein (UPF0148 family)